MSIGNGRFRLSKAIPKDNKSVAGAWIDVSFDVYNLGNTPAEQVKASLLFDFPRGWTVTPGVGWKSQKLGLNTIGQSTTLSKAMGAVGQKQINHEELLVIGAMSSEAQSEYEKYADDHDALNWMNYEEQFRIRGRILYRDVFDIEHDVSWCWSLNKFANTPNTCNSAN
jgi:hypothetical protein